MIKNIFITGFRYLKRNPLYAFINLAGLSIGMAAAILILIFVVYESSYDNQHRNGNRVVRLVQGNWGLHSPSLKYDLDGLSFIEQVARIDIMYGQTMAMRHGDKLLNIKDIIFTDSEIFSIMQYEFVAGNPKEALKQPFSIVFTETVAKTLFGDEDPMGKVIRVDNKNLFTVTAIIKDVKHSHLNFNGMAVFEDIPTISDQADFLQRTGHWNFNYYLLLTEGTAHQQAVDLINDHLKERQNWTDNSNPHYGFQTIDQVYFDRNIQYEMGIMHGNKTMVQVFLGVALVILLLAIINFINITTANATNRAKETGVRKVVGSSKSGLVFQYLGEAILLSFLAMVIALFLVELLLPVLQNLLQKDMTINFRSPEIIVMILAGAFIIALMAGLLPAIVLSNFKAIDVLKGVSNRTSGKGNFRSILTITQFVISISLISVTLIAYQQVRFMNSKSLGIDIENIAYSRISPDLRKNKQAFKETLLQHPGILEVAYTNAIPGQINWQEAFHIEGSSKQYTFLPTTPEFLEMIGITVSEGRNFSSSVADESGFIIVNRKAVGYFGWENPLGHTEQSPFKGPLTVIGITEDFNFNDVSRAVSPLVIALNEDVSYTVCLKLDARVTIEALDHFEKSWLSFSPEFPLEYSFVNEAFTSFYQEQGIQLRVFIMFSLLSLVIAALGLYGMSAYAANRKRREVCIRKIHGAGLLSIYLLLTFNMMKLVVIAFVVATPFSWYLISTWLHRFPYHITIGWWVFGLAGIIGIIISQLTITGQVLRVARLNPAEALRYE